MKLRSPWRSHSVDKIQHDDGAYTDTGNKARPFHTAISPRDDFVLSQSLFMPHIFPNVCLMKYHNRHGVYFPAVLCRLCCHPKTLGFKRRDTDSLKSFNRHSLRDRNNEDEKKQFFEKFERCWEFSLWSAQTENTSFLIKKIPDFYNSYHLYSPKGRLPWSTPPLPGTDKYFRWFDPVQISTHGSHKGRTALLQALSTLYTTKKIIKSKRH